MVIGHERWKNTELGVGWYNTGKGEHTKKNEDRLQWSPSTVLDTHICFSRTCDQTVLERLFVGEVKMEACHPAHLITVVVNILPKVTTCHWITRSSTLSPRNDCQMTRWQCTKQFINTLNTISSKIKPLFLIIVSSSNVFLSPAVQFSFFERDHFPFISDWCKFNFFLDELQLRFVGYRNGYLYFLRVLCRVDGQVKVRKWLPGIDLRIH